MDEHLKSVQQEITYAQHRVDAERREIETEEHLQLMADKEAARIRSDAARLESERQALAERVTSLQASIFRGSEKLDQFKLLMNWNQEELDQWAVAQRQKEEDNEAVEKYRRQDESKLAQLRLGVEKLTQQVSAAKAALDAEATDTQAAQIQLERAAQDFRALHAERQALLRQWDEAQQAMQSRNEAIQAMATAYAERKVLLKQRQAELDAQARFLAGEVANNRELEAQLTFYEREMGKARELQAAEAGKHEALSHQVELLQATLTKAANDLAASGTAAEAARQDVERRRQKLEAVRKEHAALKDQLQGECGQLDTLQAKVAELEAMRKREEARLKALQRDHEALKKERFKSTQALHALRQAERQLVSEISGGQGQARNLAARQRALDEQLSRQGELAYAVDFGLQEIERRIARAGGHRSDDEARALNARIASLSQLLDTVAAEHAMLTAQVKQAELDLSEARRANGSLDGESRRLAASIQGLQLEADSAAHALRGAIAEREAQLVEHDVLKLQVQRLRDVLALHADAVFSLESRKAQLKLGLDERRHEIELHRDALRSELRLIKEDVHRVTLELRDRQAKVDVLAAKFETLASKSRGLESDGGGEPHSQAYYIIKAAQAREELQAAGDALDARITQSEAEVEALTNTLAQMQATNVAFSGSLRQGDSEAAQEQQRALRDQLDAAYDKLKALRQQEAALLAQVSQQAAEAANGQAELDGLRCQVEELERKQAEAQRQLDEQATKQARALKAVQRAQKLLATQASMAAAAAQRQTPRSSGRSSGGASSGTSSGSSTARSTASAHSTAAAAAAAGPAAVDAAELQQDVLLGALRGVTRSMLQELRVLDSKHPDAGIAQALAAAGLKLPGSSAAPSRSSSRAGSRAGSLLAGQRSQASSLAASSIDGAGGPAAKAAAARAGSTASGGSRPASSSGGRIAARTTLAFGGA